MFPFLAAVPALTTPTAQVSAPVSVQVTAYNDGFALITERRRLKLESGVNAVSVADVAARIQPETVLLRSVTNPDALAVLEQNYRFDLITPDNLLSKAVGQPISIRIHGQNGIAEVQTGTLLNPPMVFVDGGMQHAGGITVQLEDGTVVVRPEGEVVLRSLPEGLNPRPTLAWLLNTDGAGEQEVEVSYLTDGMSWEADYVALVNEDDTMLDLNGWVTLRNTTGGTYQDAQLSLVAGDVRQPQPPVPQMEKMYMARSMAMDMAQEQFQEKSFFEYHLYDLQRPTTVRDQENKQISLLTAAQVPVKKQYLFDPRGDWFRGFYYPGRPDLDPGDGSSTTNSKISVVLELENTEENNMGMPLPKGDVRVYKKDGDRRHFIGGDDIDHTPRKEKVRLHVGDAFDVVGEHSRQDYRRLSSTQAEESFRVVLRNRKEQGAVTVRVMEHVWGDWTVVRSSVEAEKVDATTIAFEVEVPADSEAELTYTLRYQW